MGNVDLVFQVVSSTSCIGSEHTIIIFYAMTYFKTSQMASWRNRNRARTKSREDNNRKNLSTKTIYGVKLT